MVKKLSQHCIRTIMECVPLCDTAHEEGMEDGEISSTAIAQSQLLEGVRKVMVSTAFSLWGPSFWKKACCIGSYVCFQFVAHQNSHILHITWYCMRLPASSLFLPSSFHLSLSQSQLLQKMSTVSSQLLLSYSHQGQSDEEEVTVMQFCISLQSSLLPWAHQLALASTDHRYVRCMYIRADEVMWTLW